MVKRKMKIMDTHDEEFSRLMRKQIAADKEAKEQRDNTHAQGGEPSKPQLPPSFLQGKINYPLEA